MAVALAIGAAASGCQQDLAAPGDDVMSAATVPAGPLTVTGEIGPGAAYELFLPASWNGDLVVYINGFSSAATPTLPTATGLRDALLGQGFAVAWSSNYQTRMAVDQAVMTSRQLQALFTSRVGQPAHTYALGFSLGSAATLRLVEANQGGKFDGAVTVCGPIGGLPQQIGFYMNMLVLFDYYFPGVVTSTPTEPLGFDMAAATAALGANPAAAMELAGIDQLGLAYNGTTELMQSILFPLNFATASWFAGDILARTNGQPFFGNADLEYSGSLDDASLNEDVSRYTAHPSAAQEVAHWYSPDGNLTKPVIALYVERDPVVPSWHAELLADQAAGAGAGSLLLLRPFARFGHCSVQVSEQVQAVTDLAQWVATGTKPTQ